MDVVVLGAGVIGVTTAWYLRQQGHNVRVIERRDSAAQETSFANAGQVSAHMAEPWANPNTLKTLGSWLFRDDTPLIFRPKPSMQQWLWLLKFLRESTAARYQRNLVHLANIGLYSRQSLQELRQEIGIEYHHTEKGILVFFTNQESFDKAAAVAKSFWQYGIKREVMSAQECLELEPSLRSQADTLVGGIYSRGDETGDARVFTQALAVHAQEQGVEFDYNTTVSHIEISKGDIDHLLVKNAQGEQEKVRADRYVLCLGPSSAKLARSIGISLDIYPIKGYSVTIPLASDQVGCHMGLTDAAHKVAFSRLGNNLRATAYAEITDYNLDIDLVRTQAIIERAQAIFPDGLNIDKAVPWAGLRPMTPSNLPYIGQSRYPSLYVNSGHGTIGWTQSCGAGKATAELLSGKIPQCDFPFHNVK